MSKKKSYIEVLWEIEDRMSKAFRGELDE